MYLRNHHLAGEGGWQSSGCSRQLFITDLLWMRCVTALRQFKTSVQNSHKVCCVALTCETSPKPQKCGLEPEGHKCIYGHLSVLKVYSNTLSIIRIIYLLHLMVNNIIVFYRLKPKPKKKNLNWKYVLQMFNQLFSKYEKADLKANIWKYNYLTFLQIKNDKYIIFLILKNVL